MVNPGAKQDPQRLIIAITIVCTSDIRVLIIDMYQTAFTSKMEGPSLWPPCSQKTSVTPSVTPSETPSKHPSDTPFQNPKQFLKPLFYLRLFFSVLSVLCWLEQDRSSGLEQLEWTPVLLIAHCLVLIYIAHCSLLAYYCSLHISYYLVYTEY